MGSGQGPLGVTSLKSPTFCSLFYSLSRLRPGASGLFSALRSLRGLGSVCKGMSALRLSSAPAGPPAPEPPRPGK